ncbi:MAG: hypothetical protein ACLFVO_00135 [Chloroflexaceae bacterium]
MIILERDGSLLWSESTDANAASAMEHVSIPAEPALQQTSSIVERVLDFVFDVLGQNAVELRVYEDHNS